MLGSKDPLKMWVSKQPSKEKETLLETNLPGLCESRWVSGVVKSTFHLQTSAHSQTSTLQEAACSWKPPLFGDHIDPLLTFPAWFCWILQSTLTRQPLFGGLHVIAHGKFFCATSIVYHPFPQSVICLCYQISANILKREANSFISTRPCSKIGLLSCIAFKLLLSIHLLPIETGSVSVRSLVRWNRWQFCSRFLPGFLLKGIWMAF